MTTRRSTKHQLSEPVRSAGNRHLEIRPPGPLLNPFLPGKYILVSGDFIEFATMYPTAHLMLGHLCSLKAVDLEIVVHEKDTDIVRQYLDQFHGSVKIRIIPDSAMALIGQLIVVEASGRARLYLCFDAGFASMNATSEASRLHRAIEAMAVPA